MLYVSTRLPYLCIAFYLSLMKLHTCVIADVYYILSVSNGLPSFCICRFALYVVCVCNGLPSLCIFSYTLHWPCFQLLPHCHSDCWWPDLSLQELLPRHWWVAKIPLLALPNTHWFVHWFLYCMKFNSMVYFVDCFLVWYYCAQNCDNHCSCVEYTVSNFL